MLMVLENTKPILFETLIYDDDFVISLSYYIPIVVYHQYITTII